MLVGGRCLNSVTHEIDSNARAPCCVHPGKRIVTFGTLPSPQEHKTAQQLSTRFSHPFPSPRSTGPPAWNTKRRSPLQAQYRCRSPVRLSWTRTRQLSQGSQPAVFSIRSTVHVTNESCSHKSTLLTNTIFPIPATCLPSQPSTVPQNQLSTSRLEVIRKSEERPHLDCSLQLI